MTTKEVTITARVTSDLDTRLGELARALGRSKSWVIGTALESYVAEEAHYLEAVRRGLADLAASRVVSHEVVQADFARRKRRGRRVK